jgi:outer membrane protein OmpA-like peptidoglycan-associated protein
MANRHARRITLLASLVLMIGMLSPVIGYSQFQPGQKRIVGDGQELSIQGVILKRDGEMIVLRDLSRSDTVVVLTDATKISTERKWMILPGKPFDPTVLIPGLVVTADGKGSRGNLVAETIEFSEDDLYAAMAAYAQTAPIAQQSAENKQGISQNRQQISQTNRQLAETSQEVVDTNRRINELDQYDLVKSVTVLFGVNNAQLTDEGKEQLDDLAAKAPTAKNYLVEVQGYADSTGSASRNLELSQQRAAAVIQYLTVKHNIPLRRITQPMGYGESKASDMSSTAGRAQERRVEVRVLVNKGLNQ